MHPNKKDDAPFFEKRVFCKIIETKKGLDALVFEIDHGDYKIICIANVPEADKDSAPVYLKYKFNEGRSRPRENNTRDSESKTDSQQSVPIS